MECSGVDLIARPAELNYRWIACALCDDCDASLIQQDKRRHAGILGTAVVLTIDSGQLTSAIVVGGTFALEAANNGVL